MLHETLDFAQKLQKIGLYVVNQSSTRVAKGFLDRMMFVRSLLFMLKYIHID